MENWISSFIMTIFLTQAFAFSPFTQTEKEKWIIESLTHLQLSWKGTTTQPRVHFGWTKCFQPRNTQPEWDNDSNFLHFWDFGRAICEFLGRAQKREVFVFTKTTSECFKTWYFFSLGGSILTAVGGCHPYNWLQKFLQTLDIFPMVNLAVSNHLQISCSHELSWLASKVNTKTL